MVIVLAGVLQCAYVFSSIMKDQNTVVRLENVYVFVVFSFKKVLNASGTEKSLIKMSQCTKTENMILEYINN